MRNILLFSALCLVLALAAGVSGQDKTAVAANDGATYIGAKACMMCHKPLHRAWGKTKHAEAWTVLKEEYRSPDAKDEATGKPCISCHVTGWGEADRGGFVDAKTSEALLGVQCEACHGPGSKHKEAAKTVMDEKRKFKDGEPTFITKRTTNCANCHNPHVTHEQYR